MDALEQVMARLSLSGFSSQVPRVAPPTALVNSQCRAGGSNRSRLEPKWLRTKVYIKNSILDEIWNDPSLGGLLVVVVVVCCLLFVVRV